MSKISTCLLTRRADSGHAGKHAAEWCGQNFHEYLLDALITDQKTPIPDLMNETFHKVDERITQISSEDQTHSGCTAVTAFLRLEEADERKPDQHSTSKGFINPDLKARGLMEGKGEVELEALTSQNRGPASMASSASTVGGAAAPDSEGGASVTRKASTGGRLKNFMKGLAGARDAMLDDEHDASTTTTQPSVPAPESSMSIADGRHHVDLLVPKSEKGLKRVLYTANVGDARAVLW